MIKSMTLASYLLVIVLLLAFVGCTPQSTGGDPTISPTSTPDGTPTSTPDETGEISNLNELGQFPLVKEKETINVFTHDYGAGADLETCYMTKYYEDLTNVAVKWTMIPEEQFHERLNLALSGADEIDAVISGGRGATVITMSNLLKYANQGLILPIDELIENDSVYFKMRLGQYEGWREAISSPEGNMYMFPSLNECFHCMYYGKMLINQEFLKNVGLENPTTIDEFYEMLVAFKEQDANGNGDPNDEIPMMSAIGSFGVKIDTFLMSAFIFSDGENRLFLDNGRVVAAFAQPEFREGLKYLNKLYEEDLIYKESFTQTSTTASQLNSQKYESIVGARPHPHYNIGNRSEGEPVRWIEYVPIKPLVGPNGLQITRYDYYAKFNTSAGILPATCKNPQLVIRWLDWLMSDEGSMLNLHGIEGISWEAADPGSKGVDGKPAIFKKIEMDPEHELYGNISWGQRFPNFNTGEMRLGLQQPDDMLEEDGSGLEAYLYKYSYENYAPYGTPIDMIIPPLFYSDEIISEQAMLTTDINTHVEESIARFIVGDRNLDTEWDTYLNELDALGLKGYLQNIQDTYDKSPFAN